MKAMIQTDGHQFRGLWFGFILLLLCSCVTTPDPSASLPPLELPADVTINKDAGHGQKLCLALRMEHGKELLLVVDTGSTATVLDKSLAPMLTNCLGSRIMHHTWSGAMRLGNFWLTA